MAKYQKGVLDISMTACGDLSGNQYYFVRCASTAGRVQVANGASGPMPLGILQNAPSSLETAQVRVMGTSKVWACIQNAFKFGDFLLSGSVGQADLYSGSGTAAGVAMEDVAAGASNYTEILLFPVTSQITDNTA